MKAYHQPAAVPQNSPQSDQKQVPGAQAAPCNEADAGFTDLADRLNQPNAVDQSEDGGAALSEPTALQAEPLLVRQQHIEGGNAAERADAMKTDGLPADLKGSSAFDARGHDHEVGSLGWQSSLEPPSGSGLLQSNSEHDPLSGVGRACLEAADQKVKNSGKAFDSTAVPSP